LAGCHPRLLAVKVDGPTKEKFVWGFRTGMLTFAAAVSGDAAAFYKALETKAAGAIRSAVSNCSHLSQSVLAKAMATDSLAVERREKKDILEARARRVHEILRAPQFADVWEPYPFNAGYFMCVRLKGIDAEKYRKHLLGKHGVGVIADGAHDIRIAFSSVDIDRLEDLYAVLATVARELQRG
jgi:aspartate/methionine/tyrosine aminotransferase